MGWLARNVELGCCPSNQRGDSCTDIVKSVPNGIMKRRFGKATGEEVIPQRIKRGGAVGAGLGDQMCWKHGEAELALECGDEEGSGQT